MTVRKSMAGFKENMAEILDEHLILENIFSSSKFIIYIRNI